MSTNGRLRYFLIGVVIGLVLCAALIAYCAATVPLAPLVVGAP